VVVSSTEDIYLKFHREAFKDKKSGFKTYGIVSVVKERNHGNPMTIDNINVDETLRNARKLVSEDKDLSPATKSLIEVLILVVTLMANRLNLIA